MAARPVGAANLTLSLSCESAATMARVMVVLPVPGPPVMMNTLFTQAWNTASRCSDERSKPSADSIFGRARFTAALETGVGWLMSP